MLLWQHYSPHLESSYQMVGFHKYLLAEWKNALGLVVGQEE